MVRALGLSWKLTPGVSRRKSFLGVVMEVIVEVQWWDARKHAWTDVPQAGNMLPQWTDERGEAARCVFRFDLSPLSNLAQQLPFPPVFAGIRTCLLPLEVCGQKVAGGWLTNEEGGLAGGRTGGLLLLRGTVTHVGQP